MPAEQAVALGEKMGVLFDAGTPRHKLGAVQRHRQEFRGVLDCLMEPVLLHSVQADRLRLRKISARTRVQNIAELSWNVPVRAYNKKNDLRNHNINNSDAWCI